MQNSETKILCPRCMVVNSSQTKYCSKCGYEFNKKRRKAFWIWLLILLPFGFFSILLSPLSYLYLILVLIFSHTVHKALKATGTGNGWLLGLLAIVPIVGPWIPFFVARNKLKKINGWSDELRASQAPLPLNAPPQSPMPLNAPPQANVPPQVPSQTDVPPQVNVPPQVPPQANVPPQVPLPPNVPPQPKKKRGILIFTIIIIIIIVIVIIYVFNGGGTRNCIKRLTGGYFGEAPRAPECSDYDGKLKNTTLNGRLLGKCVALSDYGECINPYR